MAEHQDRAHADTGPKYVLNIEGKEYQWESPTITVEQIANLGGWDISEGVIEVDENNDELLKGIASRSYGEGG